MNEPDPDAENHQELSSGSASDRIAAGAQKRLALVLGVLLISAVLIAGAIVYVGTKENADPTAASGRAAAGPEDAIVSQCVAQSLAALRSPEMVQSPYLELVDGKLSPFEAKYGGSNPVFDVYAGIGLLSQYAPLFQGTYPTSGPEAEALTAEVASLCRSYPSRMAEYRQQQVAQLNRDGLPVWTDMQQVCSYYCTAVDTALVGCDGHRPYTCAPSLTASRDAFIKFGLAAGIIEAPDSRNELVSRLAQDALDLILFYEANECGIYPSDAYTGMTQAHVDYLQKCRQYTDDMVNAFAALAVAIPTPVVQSIAAQASPTPTTTAAAPAPHRTSPASTSPVLYSTETTVPIQLFQTPTGNIYCGLDAGNVECRISEHTFTAQQCERVFEGDTISHETVGPATNQQLLSATLSTASGPDISPCMGNTLQFSDFTTVPYGTIIESNGTTCTVEETGVRCTNAQGRGFNLARAAFDTF